MKKKIAILLVTVLTLSLAGCGEKEKNTQKNSEELPEKANVEAVASQTGYYSIYKAGTKSFAIQEEEDGVYKIVDIDGKQVLDGTFSSVNAELDGDYYSLRNYDEATDTFTSYLYNADDELVFQNTDYPGYYISSFNEGILQLKKYYSVEATKSDGTKDTVYAYYSIYLDANNNFQEIAHVTDDNMDSPIKYINGYSNGYACFTQNNLVTVNASTKLYGLMDKNGQFQEITLSNGYLGQALSASISRDGWMLVRAVDPSTLQYTGTYFYNVVSKEEVAWPEGYNNWEAIFDDGFGTVFTTNNYVAVTPETGDGNASEYDVFDLSTGQIVCDGKYAYIGVQYYDNGKMVVKKNSQYAYVDQSFKLISDWYTAASNFMNGYALIVDSGMVYAINENFEKEVAVSAGEEISYLGENFYSIKHDGLYYLVEVNPL